MNIFDSDSNIISQSLKISVAILLSFVIAFTLLQFSIKEIRWSVGLVIVVIFVFLLSVVKNKKNYLIASLLIGFSIQTSFYIWRGATTYYPHGVGPGTSPQLYAFDLPLIFLFLFVIALNNKNKSNEFLKSDIAALILILFCVLSFMSSSHPILSFTGLLVMLRMPLFYYCLSRGITSEKDLRFAVWVLIFSSFIQGTLGIAQTFGGSFSWLQRLVEMDEQVSMHQVGGFVFGRAYGTIGYTTVFAQYLGMISPLALAFFIFKKIKWEYLISGFVYLLTTIALVLSLSRAEWGNLVVVFILIFFMGIRKKIFQDRILKFRFLIVFLMIFLIGLIFSARIISRLSTEDYSSAYERIPMAKVALNMIVHNPILGVGLNNYPENMYSYGMGRLLPGQIYGVHNSFLFLAAEIGILGFLALLYLWFVSYKRLIFCFRNGSASIWIIAAGLICGLTALFIHSNVEQGFHVHQQLNGMLWSFFGIAAAMKTITVNNREGS